MPLALRDMAVERVWVMQEVLLVVHLMLAIAIVITVLLQRSEGGALGMGGSSGGGGGGGGLMTGREAANLLTRSTAVLPAIWASKNRSWNSLKPRVPRIKPPFRPGRPSQPTNNFARGPGKAAKMVCPAS